MEQQIVNIAFCLNQRKKNLEEENLKENLEAYQMEQQIVNIA